MSEPLSSTLDETVLSALRDSVGGDDAFVVDLVETYLSEGAGQVGAISAAVAAGDASALVSPAHTLKSASYTVGAMSLGDLARSLEHKGRSGALDGAQAEADAARTEWTAVDRTLRAWSTAHR